MQTALHILTLVEELNREASGAHVVSTEFYKKERAAYLFLKAARGRLAFGFVYHPHGTGVFLVPASKIKLETREKPRPFFSLEGSAFENAEQLGLDRLFRMNFRAGDTPASIVCEALGQNGNLWLLDSLGNRQATLRKRDYKPGTPYDQPDPFDGFDPFTLTAANLHDAAEDLPTAGLEQILAKKIIGFNRTLAREAVRRNEADPDSDEDFTSTAATVKDLAERFRRPDVAYLHRVAGRPEVYPFKLGFVADPPEKFKTLSLAVMRMTELRQTQVEEADERKTVTGAVSRAIKRLERRLRKIKSDIAEAADYEQYKRLGELLQINFAKIERGMDRIVVEDVYDQARHEVAIPLDSALAPAENVENYFKRYRKGREGLDLLKRRLEISRQELAQLQAIYDELDRNFDSARERYRSEIDSLLPKDSGPEESAPRLPFKEYTLSTGLTIFVGRDGSDNDRTTFEYAKPYETWLHTQQCPGSHVVMKHPNKSFEPSKQEITEAAAIAAWFSKARNDTLVPVIYTERRYVRKPRKAKPGLVTVEREKSVMVAPTKPAD